MWQSAIEAQLGQPLEAWVRDRRDRIYTYDPTRCPCCGTPLPYGQHVHDPSCPMPRCDRRDHHAHINPVSWRDIADELEILTGIAVSYESLRRRWPDPADRPTVWAVTNPQ